MAIAHTAKIMRQGYCHDYNHYRYYDRNQHTKLLQLKKTNFYSLFKNVVKAESHTLHSCKGQRKFIAL